MSYQHRTPGHDVDEHPGADVQNWTLVERDYLNDLLLWTREQPTDPVVKNAQDRLERQLTCEPPDWWFTEPEAYRPLWLRIAVITGAILAPAAAVVLVIAAIWVTRTYG